MPVKSVMRRVLTGGPYADFEWAVLVFGAATGIALLWFFLPWYYGLVIAMAADIERCMGQ